MTGHSARIQQDDTVIRAVVADLYWRPYIQWSEQLSSATHKPARFALPRATMRTCLNHIDKRGLREWKCPTIRSAESLSERGTSWRPLTTTTVQGLPTGIPNVLWDRHSMARAWVRTMTPID